MIAKESSACDMCEFYCNIKKNGAGLSYTSNTILRGSSTSSYMKYLSISFSPISHSFFKYLNTLQESHSFSSVDDTMIVSQGKVHHGMHDNLALHNSRTVVDCVNSKNCRLRSIQNGRSEKRSKDTTVRDGECAA